MSKTIFNAPNLLKAYLDCRATKRHTINAIKFEVDLENKLANMQEHLTTRNYKPGRSICFVVSEPKPREIFAAEFSDRVIHHLLINQIESIWEKRGFIEDTYACRPGKGNHFGVKRVAVLAKKFWWYGQFDIGNFFASINKPILFEIFKKKILEQTRPPWWQEEVCYLAKIIIFNNPTRNYFYKGDPNLKKLVPLGKSLFDQNEDTGMPIGNLTSQFLANVYLSELDHYVKDDLGCVGYARYVDDFLIFSNSKEEIIAWRNKIRLFLLERLKLKLHPRKQQIQICRHGIPFVGYFIKPWGVTVRRNVVKTLKNQMYRFNKEITALPLFGKTIAEKAQGSLNSYFGHLGQAKTRNLRRHLLEEHMANEFKKYLKISGDWHHLKCKHKKPDPTSLGQNPKGRD